VTACVFAAILAGLTLREHPMPHEHAEHPIDPGESLRREGAADAKSFLRWYRCIDAHFDAAFSREVRDVQFGQWETAFEAVLLRLLEMPQRVSLDLDFTRWLARGAEIMEQGVLAPDTWQRFALRYS
jgi:hypothetical protein